MTTLASYEDQLTIDRILRSGLATAPGQTITGHDGATMTYRDLTSNIHALGAALAALGVEKGQTVAVMDWDTTSYLEAFFAVPMSGARLHMINIRLSSEQIAYTVNHARDDVILVAPDFLPLLAEVLPLLEFSPTIVVTGTTEQAGGYMTLDQVKAGGDPDFIFPELDEQTVATTFYTTGTTGRPKGVYFSHRQIVLHTLTTMGALASGAHTSFRTGDVYMPMTPMFHVHAWGLPYVATMLGVRQCYPGRYQPTALLERIAREGVTFTHGVPTIVQMLLAEDEDHRRALKGLKMIVGGAPMPPTLARRALEAGIDVCTGYGMSETCPILTLARVDAGVEVDIKASAAIRSRTGRPIPLVDLRLVDENMADATGPGEVVARAPWLTAGYVSDAANSTILWEGGWLHTGDMAVQDKDGYYRITDRKKDVIKTGGEWVSSLDLEELILKLPGVADAGVVAEPDEKWGERPAAFVVASAGASVDEATILSGLGRHVEAGAIPKYALPRTIVFVDALPRTSVGKPDKKRMRAMLAETQLTTAEQ